MIHLLLMLFFFIVLVISGAALALGKLAQGRPNPPQRDLPNPTWHY